MPAAVVTSFDAPPSYQEFPTPRPDGSDGSHYTSTGDLPLVPGVEGVGRMPDGTLRYFALADTTSGAMAEQTVIDLCQSFVLSDGADPVLVAAAMNQAMSSWDALRRRTSFQSGQTVLVLGATGRSGQMAVQVAKRLGAGRVIVAGRNPTLLAALPELGAEAIVRLGEGPGLGGVAADVDLVIDYLWGQVTVEAMTAIATNRSDDSRPLIWIPAAALHALPLQIVGSGQGSVSTAGILAELPALVDGIGSGALHIDAREVPLADVASAWHHADSAERIVLIPA